MHAETKDEMRDKILEAALKRFTHYSASKTTMNEIADDLHCSKASLYYYFPDKKGLHYAVLEKIGDIFFADQEAETKHMQSASETLQNIIEVKVQFVKKYARLELFKVLNDNTPETHMAISKMREKEDKLITTIFQHGVDTGEFIDMDVTAVAELYNRSMEGLRFSAINDNSCNPADLDTEDFERIIAQQKMLTEIFVKGLKYR